MMRALMDSMEHDENAKELAWVASVSLYVDDIT